MVPTEHFAHGFLLQLCCDSLNFPVCLSNVGDSGFALWPHFSDRSKKSCWFFNVSSFLLVRMDWRVPNSLHIKPEAWVLFKIFPLLLVFSNLIVMGSLSFLDLWVSCFVKTWKNFGCFLQIFFFASSHFLSFWDCNYTYVWLVDIAT